MLKYRSYIVLFAVAAMTASCSQDVAENSVFEGNEVYATLPELEDGNVMTRSTLTYNASENKMHFSWENGDKIGVFAVNDDPSKRQQIQFDLKKGAGTSSGGFDAYDDAVRVIGKDNEYIAFRPYTKENDYEKLDVKYDEQKAGAFPKMKYYSFNGKNKAANATIYNESEKAASAHLGKADYMVALPVVALEDRHCSFDFKRMGAVVRFYLKCPRAMEYEGLQLVAKGKKFILEGQLDAYNREIVPVVTGNVQELQFSPALDMTDTTSDYYYNGSGYIISYMMMAPIDLRDAESLSIYLKGSVNGNAYYYKSKGELAKPNLTANMFYQWTSADNTDNPAIIFDEISVQDWEEVIYSNGEEGTGTSIW